MRRNDEKHYADSSDQRVNRKGSRNSTHEDTRSENTTEEEVIFSFLNHKRLFHRLLMGYNCMEQLVDDAQDFWLFLTKYEALLRRSGQSILAIPTEFLEHKSIIPNFFDKSFLINLKIKPSKNQMSHNDEGKNINEKKIRIFFTIVKHYLDFKQKERFQKLKKLRKFQSTLPISAYEKEIVDAVKNESILILAGDSKIFNIVLF